MLTARLELRPTVEADRARFVELFGDPGFMVFSGGVLDVDAAHRRVDRMVAAELAFAKQSVIERSSGALIGYAGADWFPLDGERRLEFGYRLIPAARGLGYGTEAARALIEAADATWSGELLAIIDPTNRVSQRVALGLGFTYWRRATIGGFVDELYRRTCGPDRPTSG